MKISKKDLLSVIEFSSYVTKGSPKGHTPFANQLRLTAGNGRLMVEASDGSQFGWRVTDVDTGDGGLTACVVAANLKTVLDLCVKDLHLSHDGAKLIIKSGGSEFKLNTDANAVKDFPTAPGNEYKETNWPAVEFSEAMDRVSFASTDSPAIAEKWGVHVNAADKLLVCDAYSGLQYARFETAPKKKPTPGSFFVPLGFMPNLARELLQKGAKFSFSDKTAQVVHDAGGYVCALANVKALSVEAYLGQKRDQVGKFKAADWLPFFHASASLGGDKLCCKVTIDGKNFYHTGPSGENAVPLPAPLKACNLNLNAHTFSSILEALEPGEAEIAVSEATAIFVKQGNFLACTSQLRET